MVSSRFLNLFTYDSISNDSYNPLIIYFENVKLLMDLDTVHKNEEFEYATIELDTGKLVLNRWEDTETEYFFNTNITVNGAALTKIKSR